MKKAFTITELLLAITLMAVLMAASGVVFQVAVKAHRTASATAEIARKLRGITDQLNADFKGLRKDGEIFITWVPNGVDGDGNGTIDRYERLDRIMFFSDGDFQSYKEWSPVGVIHGNVARISYILAKDKNGNRAQLQAPGDRVLARSQHIFTADPDLVDFPWAPLPRTRPINLANIPLTFTELRNNAYEYDNLLLGEWLNISWIDKREMLTIVTDILVDTPTVAGGGLTIDTASGTNIYQLLCEGVGDFSIQGWYVTPGSPPRWFPSVDPDGNGDLVDTDFTVNAGDTRLLDMSVAPPRLVYPWPWDLDPLDPLNAAVVDFGGRVNYPWDMIDRDNFDRIPGLGRALKFTFTLYDSRGIFKEGKKFTHIVYLDE